MAETIPDIVARFMLPSLIWFNGLDCGSIGVRHPPPVLKAIITSRQDVRKYIVHYMHHLINQQITDDLLLQRGKYLAALSQSVIAGKIDDLGNSGRVLRGFPVRFAVPRVLVEQISIAMA